MKKLILYLSIVGFTLYILILYDKPSLLPLIIGQLLFLLINLSMLIVCKLNLKVNFNIKQDLLNKDELYPIELIIENNSWFPISKYKVKLSFTNSFSNKSESLILTGAVNSKKTTSIKCDLKANYCGAINCEIISVDNYDLLHMFKLTTKSKTFKKVLVLPKNYFVNVGFGLDYYTNQQIDASVSDKSTDENLNNYNIREYHNGDHFKKIHWKISAKVNQLMVREIISSSTKDVYLVLHLNRNSNAPVISLDMIDALLDATLTISNALLKENCFHFLTWYDFSSKQIASYKIDDFKTLQLAIKQIINNCLSWINIPLIDVPTIDTKQHFAITLDRNLCVSLNNEPIYELDYNDIERSLNKLYITI